MEQRDVIIIGGGFAGAATAWWLKRLGVDRVTVLEQEAVPGSHASGKNAGIARQAIPETPLALLAARGTSFIRRPPADFCETPLFEPTGGFLLSSEEDDPRLESARKCALAAGVHTYAAERAEVIERVPVLQESPFRSALACPRDGLVDIHALLSAYLAPVETLTGAKVTGFRVDRRRVISVETHRGAFGADWVVNAAGAWAAQVASLAGAQRIGLTPRRRHLLHTGPLDWVESQSPYVWSLYPAVYFRPESRGLLLCPCDEMPWEPCAPPSDEEASAWLSRRLSAAFPRLANLPIARSWAELRTFSEDELFVVGRDTQLSNFLWVAGLGGHGMTTSAAVGELAAALLLGAAPPVEPEPYDPARFE
jgi:D-arginine dehydrogenase